jgi:alpha-galactosidase/6-phospho-beta-glucosidase family protein
LPALEQGWLKAVRPSERLLADAILQNSLPMAISALEAHPGVASRRHAVKFLTHYFEKDLTIV